MEIIRSGYFGKMHGTGNLAISMDGWVRTDSQWVQKPLPAPYSRIYFVAGGSGVLYTDHMRMTLEPGFAYLAPCGCQCGFYGTDTVTKLFFHINVMMPNGYDLFVSCKDIVRVAYPISQIEKLKDWYFSNDMIAQTLLKASVWSVIGSFAESLGIPAENYNGCSKEVFGSIKYIRENLHAGLSIKDVCTSVYTSSTVLAKKFQKEMGVTMGRYIEDLIMQKAQSMLLNGEKTIGQISTELGFCDQFYFSRRFKTRYGITPKDYRKNSAKIN